jgi:hypothetical protein
LQSGEKEKTGLSTGVQGEEDFKKKTPQLMDSTAVQFCCCWITLLQKA